jgi:predicted DNA-binding WGR domain protein
MKQLALFPVDPQPSGLLELDGCSYVRLVSIDPEQNRFRFYTISWQKTLWGEWTIRSTWGRIGGMGTSQVAYFQSEQALRMTLPKVLAQRRARGYRPLRAAYAHARYKASPDAARVHQLITAGQQVDRDWCTP